MQDKARKLGCADTCAVSFTTPPPDSGNVRPCTPPKGGLCVVYLLDHTKTVKDELRHVYSLRITHVASGLALFTEYGCYPATAAGMRAAKREIDALLPLANWTLPGEELLTSVDKVAVEVACRRSRFAFAGKLVSSKLPPGKRTTPGAIFPVIHWRVYLPDGDAWRVYDFAEIDSWSQALETASGLDGVPLDTSPLPLSEYAEQRGVYFGDVVHELPRDGERRTLVAVPDDLGFDRALADAVAVSDKLTLAELELRSLSNPRAVYGTWKSGAKAGQLKLPAEMSDERVAEVLAQQDSHDSKSLEIEDLHVYLDSLRIYFDDVPQRVYDLRPLTCPDGEREATELLAAVEKAEPIMRRWSHPTKLSECARMLTRQLLEYASVREHGFAPGERCLWQPDSDDTTEREAVVEDVVITRNTPQFDVPEFNHEREIACATTGER